MSRVSFQSVIVEVCEDILDHTFSELQSGRLVQCWVNRDHKRSPRAYVVRGLQVRGILTCARRSVYRIEDKEWLQIIKDSPPASTINGWNAFAERGTPREEARRTKSVDRAIEAIVGAVRHEENPEESLKEIINRLTRRLVQA